jgi:uncharacterized protein (TIGR02217 family)
VFDEVRLPEDIEKGALGGPGFRTTILTLVSGFEKRNQSWSQSRGRWDIGYGIQSRAQLEAVLAFFYARRGRARGFRFRDWLDYRITSPSLIATGDGVETEFQAVRRYTDAGANTFDRVLTKLVSGTLAVYIDDVLQTETTDYTVDYNTGLITFVSPPGDTLDIEITTEFDAPVRFDDDHLGARLEHVDAGEYPSIPIIEVRV